jgi:hypothetical protein
MGRRRFPDVMATMPPAMAAMQPSVNAPAMTEAVPVSDIFGNDCLAGRVGLRGFHFGHE